MSVQPTGVVMQQPAAESKLLVSKEGHRTWSSDLFGCCGDEGDGSSFLFTCLLPCVSLGSVGARMGDSPILGYCVPGSAMALRARLRTMGGISGTVCSDCITTYFCHVCAITQMERELKVMGL